MSVRRRGSRWVADYYDSFRQRRWKSFRTKEAARDFEAKQLAARGNALNPTLDPDISVPDYIDRYLSELPARNRPKTVVRVAGDLRLHVVPSHLGALKVREVSRPAVKRFLLERLKDEDGSRQGIVTSAGQTQRRKRVKKRLALGTVHQIFKSISGLLGCAVEDQIITANPVRGLWKAVTGKRAKVKRPPKALNEAQARSFMSVAATGAVDHYPAFALMLWAGLRTGEVLMLRPEDVDAIARTVHIRRPKDGTPRTVQLPEKLAALLAPCVDAARRRGDGLPWLLYPDLGEPDAPTPNDPEATPTRTAELRIQRRIQTAFARVIASAELPDHMTPHCLRHSYASLLISSGTSIAFVQQQLGHASIELTVGTYGSWLPAQAPGAVDRLADATAPAGKTS